MYVIQKNTCVKFQRIYETSNYKDYVSIQPIHGCASTVGFWGGEQIIYLQKVVNNFATPHFFFIWLLTRKLKGCMHLGRILHELVHVLGFFHMHSTADRDEYVKSFSRSLHILIDEMLSDRHRVVKYSSISVRSFFLEKLLKNFIEFYPFTVLSTSLIMKVMFLCLVPNMI